MELSKEQIQYIDHRLENDGVKYWEIRIEMLDHIVSDVEKNLQPEHSEYQFKEIVQDAFVTLGWKENFNVGGFESLTKSRLFSINKIVRKQYFNQIKTFFKTPKSIFAMLLFVFCYSIIFAQFSIKVFKITSLVLLFLPIIYGATCFLKDLFASRKSGYLEYSSFYIFFSFLMLSSFIQFLQPEGIFGISKLNYKIVVFLVTILNSILSFAGVLVHNKTLKKIKVLERKLLS